MQGLDRLIPYTIWANRTWLDIIFEKANDDDWLPGMISHIYLAEQVWFQRIFAEPIDREIFTARSKAELDNLAALHERRYEGLLRGDLGRIVSYQRFNGDAYESTVLDILLHLVTHGSHHRGQMARHASKAGLPFPTTDYINHCRVQQI